jgi:16S rRNA (guanine527-N7)-methyltransferase
MSQIHQSATSGPTGVASSLAVLLSEANCRPLASADLSRFEVYLELILRWNARTNLTAIRNKDEILRRHFLESIACAQALPSGIETLLDFGSGAGLPGIPIAICRPEIQVILAESQNKKAAFLREAVSVIGLKATVFSDRAETLGRHFDCVTMRAVDRMEKAVGHAAHLVPPGGVLALLTTVAEFGGLRAQLPELEWQESIPLPGSLQQELRFGIKRHSDAG